MRSVYAPRRMTRRHRLLTAPVTHRYFQEEVPTDHILYDKLLHVAPARIVEAVIQRYRIAFYRGRVVFPFFRYWDQNDDRIKDVDDLRSVLACELDKKLRYKTYEQCGQFGNLFGDHLIQDFAVKNAIIGIMARPVDALIMQCWFDHHLYTSSKFLDLTGGRDSILFLAFPITWFESNLVLLKRKKVPVVLFPPIHQHDFYISSWRDKTKNLGNFKVYNYPKMTEKGRHIFEDWSVSDFLFYGEGRIPTDLFE